MSIYSDDQEREGPIVVRRPVYDAGMKFEAEAKAAGRTQAFDDAESRAAEFRAAGKPDDAAFWDEGTVIRPGSDRPRSDSGC